MNHAVAIVIAPRDSVSALLAERLATAPGISGCDLLCAPLTPPVLDAWVARLSESAPRVVVYRPPLAGRSGRPDLDDARAVLGACARWPPQRLVVLSSAAAVEPHHHHPGHVAEPSRPLPPAQTGNPVARGWLELEELVASLFPGTGGAAVTVLRPVPVAASDSSEYLPALLAGRVAFSVTGYDPTIQLLAPDDLAAAVVACALAAPAEACGLYHVTPAGAMPVRAALRLAGVRRIPVAWSLQRAVRAVGAMAGRALPPRFRHTGHSAAQLDYLRHPSTVSGGKLARELGVSPRHSGAAAVVAAYGRPAGGNTSTRSSLAGGQDGNAGGSAAGGVPAPASAALAAFDDYGMDPGYIAAYGRTLFRFLRRAYWRLEVRGLEHVPRAGGAVLTGIHRGFMPWDGVMALHTIARALGRHPRFLIHPCLVKFPFLANYMTKLGGILACQENADWVLGRGELLGMYPEGIHGAFTMYRRAYRLGKFGRDEYVRMALRHGVPIVPFVTVGSAEIYPIWGKVEWSWIKRLTEWPFLPLCPNFPLPGLPLPSKWHTRFLPPLHVAERYPPEAAEDPAVVRAISGEVRGRMEEAIAAMLARRRSIFFGSVFGPEEPGGDVEMGPLGGEAS